MAVTVMEIHAAAVAATRYWGSLLGRDSYISHGARERLLRRCLLSDNARKAAERAMQGNADSYDRLYLKVLAINPASWQGYTPAA